MENTKDPVPLALDSNGHPITVPDNATGWRVRRHTGGRPKQVLGADRKPITLSLDTTHDDLANMVGPGTYRLDAVDDDGDAVDCVVQVVIGEDAASEAQQDESAMGAAPFVAVPMVAAQPTSPSTRHMSDLRYALDTVAQMGRSQADAVRYLAEAQADLVKGLAGAKALPLPLRNGAGAVQFVPMAGAAAPAPSRKAKLDDDDDGEDDDDDDHDDDDMPEPPSVVAIVTGCIEAIGKENVPAMLDTAGKAIGAVPLVIGSLPQVLGAVPDMIFGTVDRFRNAKSKSGAGGTGADGK